MNRKYLCQLLIILLLPLSIFSQVLDNEEIKIMVNADQNERPNIDKDRCIN